MDGQEHFKIPIVMTPQPEGGFTVTSPLLPELLTEGDSLDEALENVKDALAAVIEIYEDTGRPFPLSARCSAKSGPVSFEALVTVP